MTTDAMTPQALVDALAAMTKPCLEPRGEEHKECMSCDGTGTVLAHPWLSEECVGHWTHEETGEHIGPTMDYLQPWHGLEENHRKSASYIQRHGTWCCNDTGQRVRRVETVHLEELFEVTSFLEVRKRHWADKRVPDEKRVPDYVATCEWLPGPVDGATPVLAALRALYAAEQAKRKEATS